MTLRIVSFRKQCVVILLIVASFVMLGESSPVLAWMPVTHYHINRMADPGFWDPHLYTSGGTGPDMFLLMDPYVEYAHAPHPNKPGWSDMPNFAYLMLKINGLGDHYSENYIAAKGWGGHIAADWVSHTLLLGSGIAEHIATEELVESYVLYKYGSISFPLKFKPRLIWHAMVNYRLMELKREHPERGESTWKAEALASTPTTGDIAERISWLSDLTYVQQESLPRFPLPGSGADSNVNESVRWVRWWSSNPTAYSMPAGIQVYPLFASAQFQELDPFSGIAYAAEIQSAGQVASEATAADRVAYAFWQEVAAKAKAQGILVTNIERKTDAWGEETLEITPTVLDTGALRTVFQQIVEQNIQSPTSVDDLNYALFQKRFVIEQQTTQNILMDFTPPTVSNPVPAEGALAEGTTPTMSANVQDLPDGMGLSGVEPSSIVLTLDGVPVSHTYAPELNLVSYVPASSLSSGTHQVSLKVEDKAHNRTVKNWSFVIDPYPPETTATLNPPSPNGLNNWYVSDVTVSLSATDNPGGSGVDKTEYSLNNGATWQTYTAPFTVTSEGETKILYRSQDKVGNIEQPKEISFKIDKTPPNPPLILLPQDNSFLVNPIAVSGQAEALSSVTILSDGMPVLTASAGIGGNWGASLTLPEGPHALTTTSKDEAGNTSLSSLPTNVLVRYATTLSFNPDCQRTGQYSDSVSLTAALSSSLGPVSSKTIVFTLGSQEVLATTDSNGVATATVTLSQPASLYDLKATFAGDNTYKESTVSQPFIIEKEDSDLIYTGDALSSIVGSPTFTARLTDKDSGAPIPGREVIFSLGSQTVTSTTDQDGIATAFLVLNQPQGIYTLQVSFLGDGYYLSSSSLPSYFVIYDPFTGEKATGGGWIERGLAKANFGFNAEYKYGESLPRGELQYKDHGTGLNIHSASFSWLIFQGSSATLTGLATANGVGGYSFRLEVSDLAEPGKGQDFFRLTLYNSNGEVFYSSEGILTQGNIKLH